jgi:hypothetical protein
MQYRILLSFLLIYAVDGQAQKVCRQNYKNEASVSYNNLLSFALGSTGLSYERSIYHKKNKNNFISLQVDYVSMINLPELFYLDKRAYRYIAPYVKYNVGDKHIYSIGLGGILSFFTITPAGSLSYKYDFRKYKLTFGAGLQVSYLGLASSVEQYNPPPKPPIVNTGAGLYIYSSSWKDRILFNVRIGKYF